MSKKVKLWKTSLQEPYVSAIYLDYFDGEYYIKNGRRYKIASGGSYSLHKDKKDAVAYIKDYFEKTIGTAVEQLVEQEAYVDNLKNSFNKLIKKTSKTNTFTFQYSSNTFKLKGKDLHEELKKWAKKVKLDESIKLKITDSKGITEERVVYPIQKITNYIVIKE